MEEGHATALGPITHPQTVEMVRASDYEKLEAELLAQLAKDAIALKQGLELATELLEELERELREECEGEGLEEFDEGDLRANLYNLAYAARETLEARVALQSTTDPDPEEEPVEGDETEYIEKGNEAEKAELEAKNLRACAQNVVNAYSNPSPGPEKWEKLRQKIEYLREALR